MWFQGLNETQIIASYMEQPGVYFFHSNLNIFFLTFGTALIAETIKSAILGLGMQILEIPAQS